MARITYETTEEALAALFGAKDYARARTFRAMIGNLRRLGLPGGAPGPGKAFIYTQSEIDIWLVALSLERHGVPPSGVVEYAKKHGARLAGLIKQARARLQDDLCIVIDIDRMSPRWTPQPDQVMDITASFWRTSSGMDELSEFLERDGSGILLNLSAKLRALDAALREACLRPLYVAEHVART